VSNLQRSQRTSKRKITLYGRIQQVLATDNIPALRRVMHRAVTQRRMSPELVFLTLQKAMAGTYKPRGGWNQRELDMSFLAKVASGSRFLGALNRADGYASATTIRTKFDVPRLVVSSGKPEDLRSEINSNITAFFNSELLRPPQPTGISQNRRHVGVVSMWDDISIEEHCQYEWIRNISLGLAREYAKRWPKLQIDSDDDILAMKNAVENPDAPLKLRYGKDATVAAIAPVTPLPPTNVYHPVPLMVSANCKETTVSELVEILQTMTQAWKEHPDGQAKHGPIVTYASDGDGVSRAARHQMCTEASLDEVDPELNAVLSRLIGLNTMVSKDGATHSCDFKHLWKRWCTGLRSPDGIIVFGTLIRARDFEEALTELGFSEDEAKQLFDWKDKQNVPKATLLLQSLKKLEPLPTDADRRLQNKRTAICFLAEMLSYFLMPFIDSSMSLSDQIESLSTYAHLAATVQISEGTSCLTSEVYADSQATVKNIIFTVARMQLVDGTLKLYIILDGTDRLELVFSNVRTQDHSRNVDVLQLGQKLGIAAAQEAVYARNPELDPGHKRSKTKAIDGEGVDHRRPKDWADELVVVGDVDLEVCWDGGLERNDQVLQKYYPGREFPNLREHFGGREDTHDYLRPEGQYIGVSPDSKASKPAGGREAKDTERSELLDYDNEEGGASTDSSSESSDDTGSQSSSDLDSSDEDWQLHDLLPASSSLSSTQKQPTVPVTEGAEADPEESGFSPVLSAEAFARDFRLQDVPAGLEVVRPIADVDPFVTVNGKKIRKSSRVPALLSTHQGKSADRFRRVQGQTRYDTALRTGSGSAQHPDSPALLEDVDTIEEGDHVASLVRSSTGVCLTIMQVAYMRRRSSPVDLFILPWAELDAEDSDVTVYAVALELSAVDERWEWTGQYLRRSKKATRSLKGARKQSVLEIRGCLVAPLVPEVVAGVHSWDTPQLQDALNDIWSIVNPVGSAEVLTNLDLLPDFKLCDQVPYVDADGQWHWIYVSCTT
jgi:hypothetical protein